MVRMTRIDPSLVPVEAASPALYVRAAFEGADVAALIQQEVARLSDPDLATPALLNLGTLYQLVGRRDDALICQAAALQRCRLFRHAAPPSPKPALRLLAIMTAGDLMANTPLELALDGRPVEIIKLFVSEGDDESLSAVPDHDLAIVAVSESDDARSLLRRLEGLAERWPRPMINDAAQIAELARDRLYRRLEGIAGLLVPPTVRASREAVAALAEGRLDMGALLPGGSFPVIVRPVGSHAGKGLDRLDTPDDARAYLDAQPAAELFLSPFIDYRGADGRYPKLRVALLDGQPYLAHMAIGDHWMVHYLNAGMTEDAAKRRVEEQAMATFDDGFARRHAATLAAVTERLGLDYVGLDCAEMPDGRLLVFEADVAMIIHDLDPADLFPYKKPQMRKVFDAFEAFLGAHVKRPASVA